MSRIGYSLLQHYTCGCGELFEWYGLTVHRTMFARILRHRWGRFSLKGSYCFQGCTA